MKNQGHENYQNGSQNWSQIIPKSIQKSTHGQNGSQNVSQHDTKIDPKYKIEETQAKSQNTDEIVTFFGRLFWALGV